MLVSYMGLLLYGDDSAMGLPIAVDNLQSKTPFITFLSPIGLSFTDIELFRLPPIRYEVVKFKLHRFHYIFVLITNNYIL